MGSYRIDNSYQVTVTDQDEKILQRDGDRIGPMKRAETTTKIFNFLAQKLTTHHSIEIFQNGKSNYSQYSTAAAAGVALTTEVEYFRDMPTLDEVRVWHEILKKEHPNAPPLPQQSSKLIRHKGQQS